MTVNSFHTRKMIKKSVIVHVHKREKKDPGRDSSAPIEPSFYAADLRY